MTASALSKYAQTKAHALDVLHRVRNHDLVEDFCRELLGRYEKIAAELAVLSTKHGLLASLLPEGGEPLTVLIEQGLALLSCTTEEDLIAADGALRIAAESYLKMLEDYTAREDRRLEELQAELRLRLVVLRNLCVLDEEMTSHGERVEELDNRVVGLSFSPFDPLAWQEAANDVQSLVSVVVGDFKEYLPPSTVALVSSLAAGNSLCLADFAAQDIEALLCLSSVAQHLVVALRPIQEH